MSILELIKKAQMELRSAQVNWYEECYFECDDLLSQAIAQLEGGLTQDAVDDGYVKHGVDCHCVQCLADKVVKKATRRH